MTFESIQDYDLERRSNANLDDTGKLQSEDEYHGVHVKGVHYIIRSQDLQRATRFWNLPHDELPFPVPNRVYRLIQYNSRTQTATVIPTSKPNIVEDVMLAYLFDNQSDE